MEYIVMQKLTFISFLSFWCFVHTNSGKNLEEQILTDYSCEKGFSSNVDKCIESFLFLHHQLGVISNGNITKISVIYISIHKDLYCKNYISSLQCIHEALSSCSTDTSNSLVQHKLGQIWALTANRICHVNDKTQHSDLPHVPDQISELLTNSSIQLLGHKGAEKVYPHVTLHENFKPDNVGRISDESIDYLTEIENIFQEKVKGSDIINGNREKGSDIINELSEKGSDITNASSEKGSDTTNKLSDHTSQDNSSASNRISTSTESTEVKLGNFMDQYEPLLKLLVNLLSPAIPEMSDSSETGSINTPKEYEGIRKPVVNDTPEQKVKVKYETVFLKKLKITNIRDRMKVKKQKLSSDGTGKQTYTETTKHNDRSENSVVKEFEISKESRNSRNKRTQTTTFKWKTKLKAMV